MFPSNIPEPSDKTLCVNFGYPEDTGTLHAENTPPAELRIVGDLQGNPLKIACDLLDLHNDEYEELKTIYYTDYSKKSTEEIDDAIERFQTYFSKIKPDLLNSPILFLGDLLGDRGSSLFIVLMFVMLDKMGVPFEIILGNHDLDELIN